MAVRPLAGDLDVAVTVQIERNTQLYQFFDIVRPFLHQYTDGVFITQSGSAEKGIPEMVLRVVGVLNNGGNTALRVDGVAYLAPFLVIRAQERFLSRLSAA